MEKRCSKCEVIKSINEFRKDRTKKDGFRTQCKQCDKKWDDDHRIKKRKAFSEWFKNNRDKKRKIANKYSKTQKGKDTNARHFKKRSEQYPEKMKAKQIINNAIRDGKMNPARSYVCSKCNKEQAQHYHHPDYSKPLEVIPVCISCHIAIHKK